MNCVLMDWHGEWAELNLKIADIGQECYFRNGGKNVQFKKIWPIFLAQKFKSLFSYVSPISESDHE